ncbi:hypothetical protein AB0952_32535 [Streptomyces caniferus]|uniref:hypothetical protein n=1 Tax=Streptomyces caniferus TaxID=285557 RepID=UPI003453B19A
MGSRNPGKVLGGPALPEPRPPRRRKLPHPALYGPSGYGLGAVGPVGDEVARRISGLLADLGGSAFSAR